MEPNAANATCKHHWVLGQPQDGQIAGFCRKCDARRSFPAYIEDFGRGDQDAFAATDDLTLTAAGGARLSGSVLPGASET
jgi:hypothetical protein